MCILPTFQIIMATASTSTSSLVKSLEEQVTCTVCLDIFENAHSLQCLHSLCLDCIHKIKQPNTNMIECPECREQTSQYLIRHDFKLQNLVEFYKKTKEKPETLKPDGENRTKAVKDCEVCLNPGKRIRSKCENCDEYMCCDCENVHKKMKICQGHVIKDVGEDIVDIKERIKQVIWKVENARFPVEERSLLVERGTNNGISRKADQLKEVDEFIREFINKIEEHGDKLKQKVIDENDKVVSEFQTDKASVDKVMKGMDVMLKLLRESVDSDDLEKLTDALYSFCSNIDTELEALHSQLPNKVIVCKMPVVKIVLDQNFDVNIRRLIDIVDAPQIQDDVTKLLGCKFTELCRINTKDQYTRISYVNNQLWCSGDSLHVCSKESGEQNTKIQQADIRNVGGVVLSFNKEVIAACLKDSGLHRLDVNGGYIGKISDGRYADVCSYNEKLYALEYKSKHIEIYTYDKARRTWCLIDLLNMLTGYNYKKSSGDRLFLMNDTIFICSMHHLFQYNLRGVLIKDIKLPRTKVLCCVADVGMLFTDHHRNQLEVYKEGEFHDLQLPSSVLGPLDAVVDIAGQNLWVVAYGTSEIVKFRIQS